MMEEKEEPAGVSTESIWVETSVKGRENTLRGFQNRKKAESEVSQPASDPDLKEAVSTQLPV